jgi:L-amino acid N-acyltransferase YncA
MAVDYRIDDLDSGDAAEVLRIYEEGIATGNSTFEAQPPSWSKWDEGHLRSPRLVARQEAGLLGWAALSPVSTRCVYSGVAEVSIYVSPAARGRRVGKTLLLALIDAAEKQGIWTLQAGIFPENEASLALVKSCGFRVVGVRERLGKMTFGPLAGTWRDVVFLERRSKTAGLD